MYTRLSKTSFQLRERNSSSLSSIKSSSSVRSSSNLSTPLSFSTSRFSAAFPLKHESKAFLSRPVLQQKMNQIVRFHSVGNHNRSLKEQNSLETRQERLPAVYENLAKEINEQTRFAKYKYWAGYGALIALSTVGAEFLIQQLVGVSDLGWTFLAATGGSSLATYVSLRFSGAQKIAESMGGTPIQRGQASDLDYVLDVVKELSSIAKLKAVPKCYLIPTHEMNAFAAGLNAEGSVVAVTRGILQALDREELKAVLAHEIGHLSGQDSKTATHIIAINAGFFALLRLGLNALTRPSNGGQKDGNKNKQIAMALVAVGATSALIGTAYRLAISRSREFSADACSVAFTGNSQALGRALLKISKQHVEPSTSVLHSGGNHAMYSHMYLNNPISKTSGLLKTFQKLTSTHPPTEDRIARLAAMERGKLESEMWRKKMGGK